MFPVAVSAEMGLWQGLWLSTGIFEKQLECLNGSLGVGAEAY